MKINYIELFLIIILIIKSKNDSAPNNTSTIFSTNPILYSTNDIHSYANKSLISTNIISAFNNDKNIVQCKSNISSMNTTFINVKNIILGQTSNFASNVIETTIPKINSIYPNNKNTPSSLEDINTFQNPKVNMSLNNNSLFFLQVQAMDNFIKLYLFYDKSYPNSLKSKIYVDTPSGDQIIIREKILTIANYSRIIRNFIEYKTTLPDYQSTQNLSITIEKMEIIEDENDIKNRYDIFFGVDEDNLNTIKAENLINDGSLNISDIFNKTNYNYYIYDVENISEGCNFFINLSENRTIYNRSKKIELNFTSDYNGTIIKAICTFSPGYKDLIPCTINNQANGNYIFKPFVFPFEDEIFIFRQKKEQVFHLFCKKNDDTYNKTTKLIVIATVLSIMISIGFLVILVVACFKHRDNMSPVSNQSVVISSNTINKEVVDSTMTLNK